MSQPSRAADCNPGAEVITTTQLGCCLIDGGVIAGQTFAPEPARGRRLLEFAARQGDVVAMLQLATRLSIGRGLDKDLGQAERWLARACQRKPRLVPQVPPLKADRGH